MCCLPLQPEYRRKIQYDIGVLQTYESSLKIKPMHTGKNKCVIALDIGGTSLKWTLIDLNNPDSSISINCFQKISIDSEASAEVIMRTFIQTIKMAFQKVRALEFEAVGIGISMPGPFDYEKSISLMRHKFRGIYGIDLKGKLIQLLQLGEEFTIQFKLDSEAFLIGEAWRGAAQGYNRIIGLTLGTGIGSSFMINDRIVKAGPGIPPNGAIWCLPYEDGIVEDKISQRGILKKYQELGGNCSEILGVKEISSLASKGDRISLQAFKGFGLVLGKILKPIVSQFRAQCLVLGGQISNGFSLFMDPLKKELQSIPDLKEVASGDLLDLSALYGVAKRFTGG